jgi:hypothetical protein
VKIEVSETIGVSCPQLFSILTDFESHLKHWTRGVVGVQPSSQNEIGEPRGFVITGRNIGLKTKVRWDYTVTAYEPPTRFAGKADGGPVPFDEEFRLEEVPEGTKLTLVQDLRPEGQFKVASPLLSVAWSKLLKQNLSRLKKRAEATKAS